MSATKGNGPGATNDRPAKIHTKYATNFIATDAHQESAGATFDAKPCVGIDQRQYRAGKGCAKVLLGASNTIEIAGNLPDSEVFLRPEFKDGLSFEGIYGFGRDGLVRKAGRMAISMFETSRPPVARSNAVSGLQSQIGAKTMAKANTTTTPTLGNPSPIDRQQAIENALSMALFHIRHGDIHSATGRTIRAASMLKQVCAELQIGRAA